MGEEGVQLRYRDVKFCAMPSKAIQKAPVRLAGSSPGSNMERAARPA